MSAHSKLSPSSAHRWLACSGSVKLSEGAPETSSEYADEGTAAHQLAAWCLREGKGATTYLGQKVPVLNADGSVRRIFTVDADMAQAVQVYVDTIRDRCKEAGASLLVEQRVGDGSSTSGTADAIIMRERVLEVHDYKHGMGHRVEAEGNPQLRLYGLMALEDYEPLFGGFDEVRLFIHQPRLDHMSEAVISAAELRAWGVKVRAAVEAIEAGAVALHPGEEQCRWCPAKAKCPALEKYADDALAEFPIVSDLTEYGLGKAMDKAELVELWASSVREAARAALDLGLDVPGWRLEEGRQGNRQWTDAEKVEAALLASKIKREVVFNSKLLSPADAEKRLGKAAPQVWAALQGLIGRGPPSLRMARDDKGAVPPARGAALDEFKVLT